MYFPNNGDLPRNHVRKKRDRVIRFCSAGSGLPAQIKKTPSPTQSVFRGQKIFGHTHLSIKFLLFTIIGKIHSMTFIHLIFVMIFQKTNPNKTSITQTLYLYQSFPTTNLAYSPENSHFEPIVMEVNGSEDFFRSSFRCDFQVRRRLFSGVRKYHCLGPNTSYNSRVK